MTRKEVQAIFDRRQKAFDRLDAATLAGDYANDSRIESPTGGTHHGRAAAEKVLQAVFDGFPDLKTTTEGLIIDGDNVAQVMKMEGTDLGGFLGLPPTGKAFHLPGVFLYEFKDGLIVRERRIYDFTGMLVQVGLLRAKPI
ncbi:MAG: ester cyclase [Vicinamibacterales bacterium]